MRVPVGGADRQRKLQVLELFLEVGDPVAEEIKALGCDALGIGGRIPRSAGLEGCKVARAVRGGVVGGQQTCEVVVVWRSAPPVTARQNVTGWLSTIMGCWMSPSIRTAGTLAAASQRATQISRRTRGRRSAERLILTTTGALASRKMAFSPMRSSSAPPLPSSARWHASRRMGSAAEEENSAAASGTRHRIPRTITAGQAWAGASRAVSTPDPPSQSPVLARLTHARPSASRSSGPLPGSFRVIKSYGELCKTPAIASIRTVARNMQKAGDTPRRIRDNGFSGR